MQPAAGIAHRHPAVRHTLAPHACRNCGAGPPAAVISPIRSIDEISAPVGAAHAYDMMPILAKAIELAGSANRTAVRNALEKVREHRCLVKHYRPPFTAERHKALGQNELLMARYREDGVLMPMAK
jgi:branched-chain amino acid transport system substrate-binding protein